MKQRLQAVQEICYIEALKDLLRGKNVSISEQRKGEDSWVHLASGACNFPEEMEISKENHCCIEVAGKSFGFMYLELLGDSIVFLCDHENNRKLKIELI